MFQQESTATVSVDDADLYNLIDDNSRRTKRSTVSRRRQRMRGTSHWLILLLHWLIDYIFINNRI